MNSKRSSQKVINITERVRDKERLTHEAKPQAGRPRTRVFAITSGKGGVGKTTIVANLGLALSKLGHKVLILDADWGLGNQDVLLGIAPKYNLSHVIAGQKSIPEIILNGPCGMKILPASSGVQELTRLTNAQKIRVLSELDLLSDSTDVLLIDTAAGISSNVMDFNVAAQEILVVVSPEPTSLTDAYALMKVLSLKYAEAHCKLVVNFAGSNQEAREIYRQLNLVVEKFLNITVEYTGCILYDKMVPQSIKKQKIVTDLYPSARASRCFKTLAKKLDESPQSKLSEHETNFIWKHLYRNKFA